jgi:hypothetical protein
MNTEQTSGNSDLYFDGDIDDSGQINIADFVQFREEWFRFHGDSAIPVPEPSSATALLLGTLTTLYWLRDRRSFGG